MSSLLPLSPAHGLLPIRHGTVTLSEQLPEAITSLASLEDATLDLPPPNRSRPHGAGVLLWSGQGQALLLGPAPSPSPGLAMTDQSDAFAVLHLAGPEADAVLARLTPLNLSEVAPSHTARSLLGHIRTLFHRQGDGSWHLLLFRSMTASAIHEIEVAMRSVAARAALSDQS